MPTLLLPSELGMPATSEGGCQLKMPDVSDPVTVVTGRKANPPRSFKTHTETRMKVVNSHARVNHVNQGGGGGPRNVFATPPSSYSSKAICQPAAVRCSEANQVTPVVTGIRLKVIRLKVHVPYVLEIQSRRRFNLEPTYTYLR